MTPRRSSAVEHLVHTQEVAGSYPAAATETARRVKVHRVCAGGREYDAISVVIGDLHLSCDVRCGRDIRLAKRLAADHGAAYWCDPEIEDRHQ